MTVQYIMRAFKITPPTMHVYWTALGSPDYSATFAPYSPSELTNIQVDYSVTSPIISPGGVPFTIAGGDLAGTYPNPNVVKLQGRNVSPTAPVNRQALTWSSSNNQWEPDFGSASIYINVKDYGAVGNGIADDTSAINAAISALPTNGGTIFFPNGTYNFSSTLSWGSGPSDPKTNVKFVGASSKFMQDFQTSASKIVYTGTGDGYGIHITGNYARGWTVENLEIAYSSSSFDGYLIFIDTTAGISFHHCALGGVSFGSPYLSSAESVIRIKSTEKVTLQECIVQFAKRCIFIPDGAENTSCLTLRDCQLGNITRAHIETLPGGCFNTVLNGNIFDNTTLINPPYGLILVADGFNISGNAFIAGDVTKAPTIMYVDLYGNGSFVGNSIQTMYPSVRINLGGSLHISGNYITGDSPLTIAGSAVHGGGNFYQVLNSGNIAVDITGPAILDLGPDFISTMTGNSYKIENGSQATGQIKYDPSYDESSLGPYAVASQVVLKNQKLQSIYSVTPVGNVGSGLTYLASITIPAKSIDINGKGFKFKVFGTTASNGNNKEIVLSWSSGPTLVTLFDTGILSLNNSIWSFNGIITRTSSSSQVCLLEGNINGSAIQSTFNTASADLTLSQVFSVTGTGVSSNDIVLQTLEIGAIQ